MDHITQVKYDYYTKEIDEMRKILDPGLRKIQKLPRSKYTEDAVKCILTIFYRFLKLRNGLRKN